MSRGGFRFQLVLWSLMALLQLPVLIGNVVTQPAWDFGDYISLALLVLAASYILYLFRIRRHDGHFWDEEEARREDWDRRGRNL